MISRRRFITGFVIALTPLGATATAQEYKAQPAGKVYRVGVLHTTLVPTRIDAFRQGVRELGYIEGQNLVLEFRSGKEAELPQLAAELVRLNVDVMLVGATPAASAAKRATSTIPIVFAAAGDPISSGFVATLARPGGNMTGLTGMAVELIGKRLELLKEAVPGVRKVAVLANPTHPFHRSMMRAVEATARRLGVELHAVEARAPSDLDDAFSVSKRARAGALLVAPHPMFTDERTRRTNLAVNAQLPSSVSTKENVEAGALMFYGADFTAQWRRAATYVDKILKGAKPADLPVEQPTKFELVINMKTAKALGLTIPPSLLGRADQVIQ